MASARLLRLKNQGRASWAWLHSFFKRDWEFEDYPVAIRKQEPDLILRAPRFTYHPYLAHIVNWAVTGMGDTPEEAKENLRKSFQSIKSKFSLEGKPLIRPGAKGPVEFASQEKVSSNEELSEDFIQRVLDLEWAWISDESSLWDFHTERNNDLLYAKILEVYGVDVSDIESAKLWEIFDRIERKRNSHLRQE